jgi:hypothetical protein
MIQTNSSSIKTINSARGPAIRPRVGYAIPEPTSAFSSGKNHSFASFHVEIPRDYRIQESVNLRVFANRLAEI